MGADHKVKLEARLRLLEEGNLRRLSGTGKSKSKFEKYHVKSEIISYPTEGDTTIPEASTSQKRKHSELIEDITEEKVEKKKKKKKVNKILFELFSYFSNYA